MSVPELNDDEEDTSNDDVIINKTIKANSPFTEHFRSIENSVQQEINSVDNKLYCPEFISFLQQEFMPYIFLWAGFVLRDQEFETPTTHLVDSSVEAWFRTRKISFPSPIPPARYINETVHIALGECKRKAELLSDNDSDDDQIIESKYHCTDTWARKANPLLKMKKKVKGNIYFYHKH